MDGTLHEKNSARSYRWVRIWLAAGVGLALLLLGNSVRDYFFVSRILSIQQVRHQVTQRIAAFEHDMREKWTPGDSRLKLLSDEMNAASQHPLWLILRDMDGQVVEKVGTPQRQVFTHDQEITHFRNREPLFDVIPSSEGEVVVEVFPVYGGMPPALQAQQGSGAHRPGPFMVVEVAMSLSAADKSNLWPIRRNLMISIAAAIALLLSAGLTAWGFRAYVRGKQLEHQVEIARQVQANLLPGNTQVARGVQVAVEYEPADEVAGDFYDVFEAEGRVAFVIGDVSGKGIPAALLMGVIHGAVRSSQWTDSQASHERQTAELNRLLCERASREQFASMFWSYCDTEKKVLHYLNAGHCIPLLVGERNGETEVRRLDAGGPVLGLLPEAAYKQGCVEIQHGVMVLYSDGMTEAMNESGEEFGETRLERILVQSHRESPEKIREAILAGMREFLRGAKAHDDVTCVVVRFGESAPVA